MTNRNLALRTPSSFSYEMLLKDDQSIEHVKVTRRNHVLSFPKQAYKCFYFFGEQNVRETGRRAQGQIAAGLSAEDLFGLQS